MVDYKIEVDGVNFIPKNILVTGGCGFIGSHVVIHLAKNFPHYNIINFDKLDYCSSLKTLQEVENLPNYKFVKGDILSEDFVNYVITSNNVDTIMHFAAQTHVDNSFGNSIEFTKNNVLGTHVLLEIARQLKIKRFIHVSTDEVYGEKAVNDDSVIETSVLEPTNPYAASKAGAEHIVKSYYKSFKLPVIITRGNNVFGPHQFPEKIIPKFISLLARDKPCCIHGDGSHRRSYIYIEDVVRAFDTILHKGHLGEVYNIGTDFEISNMDLAMKLLEKFGLDRQKEFIQYFEDRPFNDIRYHIDTSKLNRLGWKPKVDFGVGLDKTIEWYKKNFDIWEGIAELALVPHPTAKLWRTSVTTN